jgi:hypothetical protein
VWLPRYGRTCRSEPPSGTRRCVRASTPPLQGWRSPCSPRSAWSPAAT